MNQAIICNMYNLQMGQQVSMSLTEMQFTLYSNFFYTSNLLLDPFQLCLHVLQFMSAVQHLFTLLLSGGFVMQRDNQVDRLVCTYYFTAILESICKYYNDT